MSYIVNTYDQGSSETEHEFNTLEEASSFFSQAMGDACDMQTAEPTMFHPSGDGREWINYLGWSAQDGYPCEDELDNLSNHYHEISS